MAKAPATESRYLPAWGTADLPEPARLSWRQWKKFVGPGIVMAGIQIGGGEWLFGPDITARYGGGLLWIATVAIVLQVFYNLECGRYALYCGEPVLTGFLRMRPGPWFWSGVVLLLNFGALIPGLSTHGAAIVASLWLGRPPDEGDRALVTTLAYVCLGAVALPVLVGGKVYRMLQAVMTLKVIFVLGFCLLVALLMVPLADWMAVLGGFLKFGTVPVLNAAGQETAVNVFAYRLAEGHWPLVSLVSIAFLGGFAGYAGGGGLSNSTYSNFLRDQGWGMGRHVGAIPSALGGKHVSLSHVGKVFPASAENLRRWRGWWRHVLVDQFVVWAPGCFLGMALPALISIGFARHSVLAGAEQRVEWAQAILSADGLRHAPGISAGLSQLLWVAALLAGAMVMLPSQMAIIDDFSRRWTDVIWTANRRVRDRMRPEQVKWIYYAILAAYVLWSMMWVYLFTTFQSPRVMTIVIANLNNLALGVTAFLLLRINFGLLPPPLRPRWYHAAGVASCGVFYLGLSALVFWEKQWPYVREWMEGWFSR